MRLGLFWVLIFNFCCIDFGINGLVSSIFGRLVVKGIWVKAIVRVFLF